MYQCEKLEGIEMEMQTNETGVALGVKTVRAENKKLNNT